MQSLGAWLARGSRNWTRASSPKGKSLPSPTIAIALALSATLWSGCGKGAQVIPDPTIPHEVAEETEAIVWARRPSGEFSKTPVRVLAGWWLASPEVVNAKPPEGKPMSLTGNASLLLNAQSGANGSQSQSLFMPTTPLLVVLTFVGGNPSANNNFTITADGVTIFNPSFFTITGTSAFVVLVLWPLGSNLPVLVADGGTTTTGNLSAAVPPFPPTVRPGALLNFSCGPAGAGVATRMQFFGATFP